MTTTNWTEMIQKSIEFIEENLTKDISVKDIAEKAYLSEFYFRRIFSVQCGLAVKEYIRSRRLTLAAMELCSEDVKVIDVAMKYGYDSADGFTRAFTKFHGITPSAARENGAKLRSFAPLKVKLPPRSGTIMEYRIVEKATFTIMGRRRRFSATNSYDKIPEFWDEHWEDGGGKVVVGMYGLCIDVDGETFDYYIADIYKPNKEIPESYETRTIPGGLWAVFPSTLETLQDTNTKMWQEWFPACKEYRLRGNYNIEMYEPIGPDNLQGNYCELWLPLEKI